MYEVRDDILKKVHWDSRIPPDTVTSDNTVRDVSGGLFCDMRIIFRAFVMWVGQGI
jgi:hypothetical protein